MKRSQNDEVHPADLQAKFGEDASLYAQVRAEAAAAAGRPHASDGMGEGRGRISRRRGD